MIDYPSFFNMLAYEGAVLLSELLELPGTELQQAIEAAVPQNDPNLLVEPGVTLKDKPQEEIIFARKPRNEDGYINFAEKTASEIYHQFKALYTSLPHVYTYLKDTRINFHDMQLILQQEHHLDVLLQNYPDIKPGQCIFDRKQKQLLVCCKDRTLLAIHALSKPNRKPTKSGDFLAQV
eukprot:CAMPEP_0117419948 /NCGR_PEP_ID=MMETSP0758-20121206/1406_1 /TAXON_ID=63605 /ORGANISM="Percolomonas cosmopolitus, Strain AE-1 (ATCC 50343)" /LENGTH=178 /DNA_ID=CAMNT_0005201315 /DNA_START=718 /DNA_END=1250 /DNA_ORIENTATION=-